MPYREFTTAIILRGYRGPGPVPDGVLSLFIRESQIVGGGPLRGEVNDPGKLIAG